MAKLFDASQFVPTEFDTAADKAKFANQFVAFVVSDFQFDKFPKWFYKRLSMTFNHIAHYNQHGFYESFFSHLAGKVNFCKQTLRCQCHGDPTWTYSDVEKVLIDWMNEDKTLELYEKRYLASKEEAEISQLLHLQNKYPKV